MKWKSRLWRIAGGIAILWLGLACPVEAAEEAADNAISIADIWQTSQLEEAQKEFLQQYPDYQFDGKQVLSLIMEGNLKEAGKQIWQAGKKQLGYEIEETKSLFVMILILGVVAALFSNFADVFQNHQVADIAFYFIYLLLITVLLAVFMSTSGIVKEMLQKLTTFLQIFVPVYLMAVTAAAGVATASAYYQLFLAVVYLIEVGYLHLFLPIIFCYTLLSIINGIWLEEKLNLLLDFLQKIVEGGLKITLGIITGFGILQSLIAPILDTLKSSALKKAVSVIPGIGGLTEGMFEMVVGSAVLIRNSIGIFMTFLLLFICVVPVIKMIFMAGTLKIGAAFIGIVSDKRMTNCANRVGDGSLLLLKIALSAIGLFIISIALVAGSMGKGIG